MTSDDRKLDGYEEEARNYDLVLRRYSSRGPTPEWAALQGSIRNLLRFFTRLADLWGHERAEELAWSIVATEMGREQIFYFPGWTYYHEDKED